MTQPTGPNYPPANAVTGSAVDGPTDIHVDLQSPTGGTGGPVTANDITDATTVGKALLTAPDASTARTALGAVSITDNGDGTYTLTSP